MSGKIVFPWSRPRLHLILLDKYVLTSALDGHSLPPCTSLRHTTMNHRLGVLVFGLLGIVSSGHSVAYAAPTIDWTPSSLTQTIALGKSQTVIVTFKATKNESNVVVRVVPELQTYIQVSPSSFQTIQRGTTTTLTVMFSAAPHSIPRTYTGTVQLRSKEAQD